MVGRYGDLGEGFRASAGGGSAIGARLAALCLTVAGVFFVLYPAIRPFSDEVSLSAAEAFASSSWLVAHSLAMAAFLLLMLGLLGLYLELQGKARLPLTSLVLSWIGIGLTLPYYGAETFGLHAVGQEALKQHRAALLSVANDIRWEEGIWFILAGLVAVAVGTILFAIAIWRSGRLPRWSGIPLAAGFALFIPQFLASQPVRVAHGLLIMAGCWWTAWGLWRRQALRPGA